MTPEIGICQTDLQGNLVRAQGIVCTTLGAREDDIKGRSLFDFWPKDQMSHRRSLRSTLVESGRPYLMMNEYVTVDGSLQAVDVNVILLRNRRGHSTGVMGIWQTVDEDRARNDALSRQPRLSSPVFEYVASMVRELTVLSHEDRRLEAHLLECLRAAMLADYESRTVRKRPASRTVADARVVASA
jgi:PAS domain S-box-containing protein